MIPMLLLPPVHSLLILVSTILKTYNGSVVDEYNSNINVIKQPFSKLNIFARHVQASSLNCDMGVNTCSVDLFLLKFQYDIFR